MAFGIWEKLKPSDSIQCKSKRQEIRLRNRQSDPGPAWPDRSYLDTGLYPKCRRMQMEFKEGYMVRVTFYLEISSIIRCK